ncbi:sigma-70 family RNA polymerase sigma factor [Bradyrhizobium sp.]|uniref:sigma-70 family RNA polymerase sigma factor n=1 Tax=Bradyrhizobium sp. TaxID=376 RepID=UPI003C4C5741
MEWAHLIGRVAAERDAAAFRTLFEHFAPRIKGFLLRTGTRDDQAEEIAQETMAAVWRKAELFDPATSGAAAWIFTIARNLRIDAARRAARSVQVDHEAEQDYLADPAESPESSLSRLEETSRVAAALQRLSRQQSDVIRLSFIEERPHAEIAEQLGIPLGTVKSRIRLAMSRLRNLLDQPT